MDTERMKFYYQNGLWDKERLEKLLTAGKITEAQYQEIVGEK